MFSNTIYSKAISYCFWQNHYEPGVKYYICQHADLDELMHLAQTNHELRRLALYELFSRKGLRAQQYQSHWLRTQIKLYDRSHHYLRLTSKLVNNKLLVAIIEQRCQADTQLTILWTGWHWRINSYYDPHELRLLIASIETITHLSELIHILQPFMKNKNALMIRQLMRNGSHPQSKHLLEQMARYLGQHFPHLQNATAYQHLSQASNNDATIINHLIVNIFNSSRLQTYYHQLQQSLYHPKNEVCLSAIKALKQLDSKLFYQYFWDKIVNFMICHPNAEVRIQACHTAMRHPSFKLAPYARQVLQDSNGEVCRTTLMVWAQLIKHEPSKVASEPLRQGLASHDYLMREHSARQYINLPTTSADKQKLTQVMLEDSNEMVRLSAAHALYSVLSQYSQPINGSNEIAQTLNAYYHILNDAKAPIDLKKLACEALLRYDTSRSLYRNWRLINHQPVEVRRCCFQALAELPYSQIAEWCTWLLKDSSPKTRLSACELIYNLPTKYLSHQHWQTISHYLHTESNQEVYEHILRIMATKPHAITQADRHKLAQTVSYDLNNPFTSSIAVQALHNANLAQPNQRDLAHFYHIVTSPWRYLNVTQYYAGYALGEIAWPVTTPYLYQYLCKAFQYGGMMGRKGLIRGLGQHNAISQDLLILLEQKLNDPTTEIVIEAYSALTNIYPSHCPPRYQYYLAQHVVNTYNNSQARCHALRILENTAQHGLPIYVQHEIHQALADADEEVRKQACQTLAALKHQLTGQDSDDLRAQFAKETSKRIKYHMCITLGHVEQYLPKEQNRSLLRNNLKEQDSAIQLASCSALARQKHLQDEDIQAIRHALATTNDYVRNDIRHVIVKERQNVDGQFPLTLLKDLNQQNLLRFNHELGFTLDQYINQVHDHFNQTDVKELGDAPQPF